MSQVNELQKNIQQDELLDISVERVKKLPVPLLVIGLGGTGAGIVNTIKTTFAQRYVLPKDKNGQNIPIPEHTAYLVVDTDSNAKGSLDNNEFVNITVPGLADILHPASRDFNLSRAENEWVNANLNAAASGMGAGTYRQSARFMLNRQYNAVSTAIKGALTKISTVQHGAAERLGRIEIVICTGICGGTGSGTFMDIPQIVRHIMATEPALSGRDYKITGYIVMPDVSLIPLAGNPLADALRMNGYAALKELDFWMQVGDHKTPYTMQFTDGTKVDWTMPPYDNCILMSGRSVEGTAFTNAARVVQTTIAENLLHYLANEIPAKDSKGEAQYTYISYEDNLKQTVNIMAKRLPVKYGYRAIGACSKRIPKKKTLYFEGVQLFNTFLPMRDEYGRLAPSDALLKDGQSVARAQAIIGNVQQLHANFAKDLTLPGFCNVTAADKPRIEAMQQMQQRPHDQENIKPTMWVDSIVKPAAGVTAENYLQAAWKRFEDFCASVMSKPELGPYALRDYLDHPDKGLIKELEAQVLSWQNLARKFKNDLTPLKQACTATWPDFEHPPLLGRTKAIEAYLQNLNNYYSGLRKTGFMEAHARAAQLLLMRVNEYLTQGLKPMCSDVERLYDMFNETPADDPTLGSDVLDVEILKPRIEQQFASSNENKRITLAFLKALCLESLKNVPNKDSGTSGVTFTYRKEGRENVLDVMRDTLNECFDGINNQSLDALMVQAVGEDVGLQQDFMKDIADSVMTSAHPLFSQDGASAGEVKADYSYLSVPDNAPEHIKYFNQILAVEHVQAKGSSLRDHINCLMAWDGLPIYRYSMMQELRQAYANGLVKPEVSMGVHLVWNGNSDAEYTNNWCRLPEPRPFFFFSSHGDAVEENAWNEARAMTERAIKCGMLEVNTNNIAPVFNLHVFWTDMHRNTPVPANVLANRVQSILDQKMDPATGATLTPDQKLAMIKAYEAESVVTTLEPGKSSECMAAYLGLVGQDIDPWATEVAIDPMRRAKAQQNHKQLSELMAAAVLSANPRLLLVLKNQLEGFEVIAKAKDEIEGQTKIWAPRIAYAETYAKMMVHGLLRFSAVGATFTDDMGTMTPVLQEVLVKDDLKAQSVFTKVGAYLADLPESNQVRMLLDHQVQMKEAEFAQKDLTGLLTKEDCTTGIAICDRMKTLVENELRQKKAALTQLGADVATLNKCIAMLTAVTNFFEQRKGQLTFAMQMMI
ncbi:MAG: hypothetical protein E7318_02850 [Clostridiales bacterium]|nr:hypothetical protein [Clostridiales bacterium]